MIIQYKHQSFYLFQFSISQKCPILLFIVENYLVLWSLNFALSLSPCYDTTSLFLALFLSLLLLSLSLSLFLSSSLSFSLSFSLSRSFSLSLFRYVFECVRIGMRKKEVRKKRDWKWNDNRKLRQENCSNTYKSSTFFILLKKKKFWPIIWIERYITNGTNTNHSSAIRKKPYTRRAPTKKNQSISNAKLYESNKITIR